VGNRAIGDRLEQIVGMERAKAALGLALTAPFIPLLFQGEEYAASTPFQYFADHEDPEMAKAVSAGRKKEFAAFGWNEDEIPEPESMETFERSKLKWDEIQHGKHAEILDWVRKLICLRRGSLSLNDGDSGHVRVEFNEDKRWLTMERGLVKVILNLGVERAEFGNPRRFPLILASVGDVEATEEKVVLPPNRLAILSGENASARHLE
jgi:maltooligosyltrehalose trehalohydrolase